MLGVNKSANQPTPLLRPIATPVIPKDSIIRQWKKKRQDTKVARRGIGGQDVPHPVAKGIIARFGWFQTILNGYFEGFKNRDANK